MILQGVLTHSGVSSAEGDKSLDLSASSWLEPTIQIVMITRSRGAFDIIVKKGNVKGFIYHERKSLRRQCDF